MKTAKDLGLITALDLERLSTLFEDWTTHDTSDALEERLSSLTIVEPAHAPRDLVTMNSTIRAVVQPETKGGAGAELVLTLVYPHLANISDGRISIMTPIGVEILGSRVGDLVAWRGRDGARHHLKIEEVLYQPEAHGDWHL